MSAWAILAKIPWKEILKYSPIIVDTADKIYDTVRKYISPEDTTSRIKKTVSLGDLARRLQKLEEHELAQAELVQNIAKQLNEIVLASKVIANRSWLTLISAIVAFVLSLVALLFALAR